MHHQPILSCSSSYNRSLVKKYTEYDTKFLVHRYLHVANTCLCSSFIWHLLHKAVSKGQSPALRAPDTDGGIPVSATATAGRVASETPVRLTLFTAIARPWVFPAIQLPPTAWHKPGEIAVRLPRWGATLFSSYRFLISSLSLLSAGSIIAFFFLTHRRSSAIRGKRLRSCAY